MNTRLEQFLRAENISQSQFADTIGVARASVSHIIAGRNKPGFDFIESMLKQFPTLNVEWLISGKGKMYKSQMLSEPAASYVQPRPEEPVESPVIELGNTDIGPADEDPSDAYVESPVETEPAPVQQIAPKTAQKSRRIEKIVIFYDDSTFQEIKG